jgi:hypothetical protein
MSVWSNVWSNSEVSLLTFCLHGLSIGDSGRQDSGRSHCHCLKVYLCSWSIIVFWMWMGGPVFDAYMLIIDNSFWWIELFPLVNMKWLHCLFWLRSVLSDMSIATPACLWGPFAWKTFFYPLTLSQCFFFSEMSVL